MKVGNERELTTIAIKKGSYRKKIGLLNRDVKIKFAMLVACAASILAAIAMLINQAVVNGAYINDRKSNVANLDGWLSVNSMMHQLRIERSTASLFLAKAYSGEMEEKFTATKDRTNAIIDDEIGKVLRNSDIDLTRESFDTMLAEARDTNHAQSAQARLRGENIAETDLRRYTDIIEEMSQLTTIAIKRIKPIDKWVDIVAYFILMQANELLSMEQAIGSQLLVTEESINTHALYLVFVEASATTDIFRDMSAPLQPDIMLAIESWKQLPFFAPLQTMRKNLNLKNYTRSEQEAEKWFDLMTQFLNLNNELSMDVARIIIANLDKSVSEAQTYLIIVVVILLALVAISVVPCKILFDFAKEYLAKNQSVRQLYQYKIEKLTKR